MPYSAPPTESSSQTQGHRNAGTFDSERARAAAERSAVVRRKRKQERERDKARRAEGGLVMGAGAPQAIPGLAEALASILRDPQARDSDVIAAVRALAELQAGQRTTLPTSVAQVQGMSTAELHALVAQLEQAHPWPDLPQPAVAQG